MFRRFLAALFACPLLLTGCAGYSIEHSGTGKGYDIYRPEPYVLVKYTTAAADDGKANEKADDKKVDAVATVVESVQIVYLPNYAQRYRVSSWNFLSKADFNLEIQNGWMLSKVTDKSDNTTLAASLIDLVKASITPAKAAPRNQPTWTLYKIVFGAGGEVLGFKEVKTLGADQGDTTPPAPAARSRGATVSVTSERIS